MQTYGQQLRDEGRAEGIAEGKAEGIAEGKAEGIAEGKAEGKAEGIAEGKAEGIAEGKAQTLLRLMEKRFGSIPEAARRRIGVAATPAQLDAWLDALLGAQSVDEVLRAGSA